MKKVWTMLLILALALCLCACQKGKEPEPVIYTFPESTTVLGVDISGLTKEDAWTKFVSTADSYVLDLNVDGTAISISAQDIDLTCNQEIFTAAVNALEAGTSADFSGVIGFNEGKLRTIMSENFNKDVTEASIVFDNAAGQYVLLPDANGQKSNPNALVADAKTAICTLTPQHSMTGVSEIIQPVRSAADPALQDALALINQMIGVQLSYTFSLGEETHTQDIPADKIYSFVSIGEDGLTPMINVEAVETYVTELSEAYSTDGKNSSFVTTNGSTVNLSVSYNGHYVDNSLLSEDIITCLKDGISGTRTAPYQDNGIQDMPYGGTYIEVDLSSQRLWFYKNGECIVTTALVSGKVAENMCTPNGVYSIYSKATNRYLTGPDYRSFVNYWMPFHGGYGLHDATWRSSFGGNIYLYDGSHGCVNLPLSAASKIYKNAPVGTKVILYGGVRHVEPAAQKLTGTTSYDVANDVGTIKLDIKPKYADAPLTYSSSDTNVATVDSSGNVTIKGIGTVKIKVTAEKFSYYTSAETTVTIKVHSSCEEGRHTWGTPTTLKAPTCQPGIEKVTCSQCGETTEQEMAAVEDHKYGSWTVTKEETCGADGTQEQTCATCGEKNTETIPATGKHNFGDWKVDKAPTCVEAGTEKRTCNNCDHFETQSITTLAPHNYNTWVSEKDPTCTETGLEKEVCGVCGGASGQTRTVNAKGHDHKWVTIKKATCTETGTEQEQCQRSGCNSTGNTRDIPATGHSYANGSCTHCGAADPGTASEE